MKNKIKKQVNYHIWDTIRDQVYIPMRLRVEDQIKEEISWSAWHQSRALGGFHLDKPITIHIWDQMWDDYEK